MISTAVTIGSLFAAPSAQPGDQLPVPFIAAGSAQAGPDDDTAPMPVILHGGHAGDREPTGRPPSSAAAGTRLRGPFEPASRGAAQPGSDGVSAAASSTLDQIKDLYLTAEAIGEDALDKHFELVSDRQRQLIKEYFDEALGGRPDGQDLAERSS